MDDVYAALGTTYQRRTPDGTDGREIRGERYRTALAMTVSGLKGRRTRRRPTDKAYNGMASFPRKRIDVIGRQWDFGMVMDIIGEAARTGMVGGCRVLMTKAKIDLFASDEEGDKLVDALCRAALIGQGETPKIFIHPPKDRRRIRPEGLGEVMARGMR